MSSNLIYDGLEKAMSAGHNILPVCNALFYLDEPLEEDSLEFFEIVIQNLKDEGLTAKEESELRETIKTKP